MVKLRAMAGFVGIRNVLAQVVNADAHAGAIHDLSDTNCVTNFGSRDKAARNATSNRRVFSKFSQRTVFRKMDEERPQHEVPAKSGKRERWVLDTCIKATGFCITTGVRRA